MSLRRQQVNRPWFLLARFLSRKVLRRLRPLTRLLANHRTNFKVSAKIKEPLQRV